MSLSIGIVGLPNVGKSTLFTALTNKGGLAANYPFATIEPNVGVVPVPDSRLDALAALDRPARVIPATVEFVDIAGLVAGASNGEGLGNQFLANIREVDAIVHVVRCFEDDNIIHVDGRIDPKSDIDTIDTELILSDMEILERRINKVKSSMKGGNKAPQAELDILEKIYAHLSEGKNARLLQFEGEDADLVKSIGLLSYKPVIYVANVSEDDVASEDNDFVRAVKAHAAEEGSEVVKICAEIESELSELDDEEKEAFLSDMGIEESGLNQLVKSSYRLLNLISFLTAGEDECRAWTIIDGTKAPQAAGKIHTDFERGFIRAETINYTKFEELGFSMQTAKEKGQLRSEGKEYVMKDGDIVNFLFNV